MVAFYYCVVDMLPKVSIITRCDKWNIFNFGLMFCSNIENLVAFGALKFEVVTGETLEWVEQRLAVLYVVSALGMLAWFVWPLTERVKGRVDMPGRAASSAGGEPGQNKDKDKAKDKAE